MRIDRVALQRASEPRLVQLRELNGFDERAIDDVTTDTAIRLLDALACDDAAESGPQSAAELSASDRDRLLAAVHRAAFGDRIESTVNCARCGSPFDLHFSLTDLLDSLFDTAVVDLETFPDNSYRLPGTPRFRLPTGRDERAIAVLPAAEAEQALLQRCVIDGDTATSPDALQHALERVAPLVDLDLAAQCAECGAQQAVHFDIQAYLLSALSSERRRLMVEVHRLAAAYGWSLDEILSLPRTERRTLVELVDAQRPRRMRA